MQAALKGIPVLSIIQGLAKYHGKKYCYPSQLKILELLAGRMGIDVSIATLNRYLRVIEDIGWVRRIRRIKRDPVKGMMFLSTVYVITAKGYGLLTKTGIAVWGFVKKRHEKREDRTRDPGSITFDGKKRRFMYNKSTVLKEVAG